MRTRIAASLLTAALLLGLSGCGTSTVSPTTTTATIPASTSTTTTPSSTVATTTTSTTTTTLDPAYRWISFSGYNWWVKSSEVQTGPGPNYFSNSSDNVWVDGSGQLHLKVVSRSGKWYCAEVVSQQSFGYGRYSFTLASRADQLNENVVLGLFTWSDAPEYNHREIDIEFSRWKVVTDPNSQFVVQPYTTGGNRYRFSSTFTGTYSTHWFNWQSSGVSFKSLQGDNADSSVPADLIDSWTYTGADDPIPGGENARLNLWLLDGLPPTAGASVEMIVKKFEFAP